MHHKLEAILRPAGFRDLCSNELHYVDCALKEPSHVEDTKTTPSGILM